MTIEYMVVERVVNLNERNDEDRSNPGFACVDVESMMLRNYGTKNWELVNVITETVGKDQSRRVFYLRRSA